MNPPELYLSQLQNFIILRRVISFWKIDENRERRKCCINIISNLLNYIVEDFGEGRERVHYRLAYNVEVKV